MSSKPAVSTAVKAPNSGAQTGLFNDIWSTTGTALNNAENTPIPQNSVAPATPAQRSGAQQMLDIAPTLGANAGATSDLTGKIASGFFSNPTNDPNFEAAVRAALQPSLRTLQGSVLPGITDASIRASGGGTGPAAYGGTGGGSPQDINNERALRDWSLGAQDTGARMAEDAYKTGLGLINQIPSLASSATTQALTPAATTEAAGGLQQGFSQQDLQNILNRYQMMTQGPLGFASSAAGTGAQGGFGTTTTTGPVPNMATQWLQGLTGGGAGLNALFGSGPGGSASAASNIASGIGSAASGAGGWLSSLLPGAGAAAGYDATALAPLLFL